MKERNNGVSSGICNCMNLESDVCFQKERVYGKNVREEKKERDERQETWDGVGVGRPKQHTVQPFCFCLG